MFCDAEHYKYLANEADLINANDDSNCRLILNFFIIINEPKSIFNNILDWINRFIFFYKYCKNINFL